MDSEVRGHGRGWTTCGLVFEGHTAQSDAGQPSEGQPSPARRAAVPGRIAAVWIAGGRHRGQPRPSATRERRLGTRGAAGETVTGQGSKDGMWTGRTRSAEAFCGRPRHHCPGHARHPGRGETAPSRSPPGTLHPRGLPAPHGRKPASCSGGVGRLVMHLVLLKFKMLDELRMRLGLK